MAFLVRTFCKNLRSLPKNSFYGVSELKRFNATEVPAKAGATDIARKFYAQFFCR